MNVNFKPLGLVAAVATATAGYAGVTNAAAELAGNTQLGDMAIVPYYTTLNGFATGLHIINTSERTQAVKVRFRRAPDSMDALDFNIVLSPYDMYTGFIGADGDNINFYSGDNSCTAPAMTDGMFTMPSLYAEGAETGYIEVISMGSPVDESQVVALAAKHGADGMPANCAGVEDNFFAGGSATTRGVVSSDVTHQLVKGVPTPNTWEASPDSLKVSYFIKSDETGVEFGNNAVHVAGFMDGPSMTNQQQGVFEGDLQGFDHPDLNGGAPESAMNNGGMGASTGLFADLRTALGAEELINDWSQNDLGDFSVDVDWVVTYPGQYVMLDLPQYLGSLATDKITCTSAGGCDNRDIPMTALFTVWDREEKGITVQEGDLVVSPQPPGIIVEDVLKYEVNVVTWGAEPVLGAPETISVSKPEGANAGWSSLIATPADSNSQICTYVVPAVSAGNPLLPKLPAMTCAPALGNAPVVGFAAWQRNFDALPAANYGRIVEHSRVQSSS